MSSGYRAGPSQGRGHGQHSLPPLQSVLSGLHRPDSASPQLPSLSHIHNGYTTSALTSPVIPGNYHASYMSGQHPPSPSTTDDEGPEYTPGSSRRGSSGSPALPHFRSSPRQSSTSSSRTVRRDQRSSGHRARGTSVKEEQKRTHERQARADQCAVLQDQEDLINIALGWSCPKPQSVSNGFSSQLAGDKLEIQRVVSALVAYLLEKEYREGHRDGNLDERLANLRTHCDRFVNNPRGPLAGSSLDTGLEDDECITIKKAGKECHNPRHILRFSDARDCRKSRRLATHLTRVYDRFGGNRAALHASLNPTLGLIDQKFPEVCKSMPQMLKDIENTIPR